MNSAHLKQSVRHATVDFVVEKALTLTAVTVAGPASQDVPEAGRNLDSVRSRSPGRRRS